MSKSTKNFGYSILLLVITLFTTQGGYSQDRDKKVVRETNKFLSEAEEAVKKNDFVSAEASYRKAISKDPSNTTAHVSYKHLTLPPICSVEILLVACACTKHYTYYM